MKKAPIQDGWGQEHRNKPWDSIHGKVEYCEMCGAMKVDGQADALPQHSVAEILIIISLMSVDHPIAYKILLRRVLSIVSGEDASLEEIGQRLGFSRQATFQHCEPAAKAYPSLAMFLTPRKHIEQQKQKQEVA